MSGSITSTGSPACSWTACRCCSVSSTIIGEYRVEARMTGLEPATSGVTGRCSNQLSYIPKAQHDWSQFNLAPCQVEVKTRGLLAGP